jgi:hypothetical protein
MRRVLAACLVGMASLAPVCAMPAQPRAPPPAWEDPDGPPVAMDVWLKRLVGRFRFEGVVQVHSGSADMFSIASGSGPGAGGSPPVSVDGVGDCAAIGEGPGVHCIFNVDWIDQGFDIGSFRAAPGSVSYLDPAMALFGLDPNASSLRYMLVDKKGLPEGGSGELRGFRARFTTPCVNRPVGCIGKTTLEAREGARLLYMTIEFDNELTGQQISTITMTMRRVEPEG